MSTLAGNIAEVVGSQGIELHNVTDDNNYRQIFNLQFGTSRPLHKKSLSDGTTEVTEGSAVVQFSGDILVTTPEITTLFALTVLTSRALPVKSWRLKATDRSKSSKTITINGKVESLTLTRQMLGHAWFNIAIRGAADSATIA